jgi:hypothetical protein
LLQIDIIPLIDNVKKAEQLVDKMAVVEHMNVVNELQNGKALSYRDCSLLSLYDTDLLNVLQSNIVTRSINGYHHLTTPQHIMLSLRSGRSKLVPGLSKKNTMWSGRLAQSHSFGFMALVCHLLDCCISSFNQWINK